MKDNPWFAEKAPQIDVSSMMAFGISITPRHSKARELAELLMFAQAAADSDVNILVEEAFYDSNSDCCNFKLRNGVEQYSSQERTLFAAAMKTVSQFEWFGTVHHGNGAPGEEEPF